MSDLLVCPRCRTTNKQNRNLELFVNVCGHSLCQQCVEVLFVRGSGSCPECKTPLKKNDFRVQLFEDTEVEREVEIRKRLLKDFNRREEDFATLREFNDYLEEIENMVYDLLYKRNVKGVQAKIEKHKKENKEEIIRNRVKKSQEQQGIQESLLREQESSKRMKLIAEEEKKLEAKRKVERSQELITQLIESDEPSQVVLDRSVRAYTASETARKQIFSTGVQQSYGQLRLANQNDLTRVPHKSCSNELEQLDDEDLFADDGVKYEGFDVPAMSDMSALGYSKSYGDYSQAFEAGGLTRDFVCHKLLTEAFAGLLVDPIEPKQPVQANAAS